jgi:hypothetical protein
VKLTIICLIIGVSKVGFLSREKVIRYSTYSDVCGTEINHEVITVRTPNLYS